MKSPYTGNDLSLPKTEVLKSIPEFFGIRLNEEPDYQVVLRDGAVEVRQYSPVIIATVTLSKKFDDYREEAFKRLAAYIFGENHGASSMEMTAPVFHQQGTGEKIPMTSPVLQTPSESGWSMSFVLPKRFTASIPPLPIDPAITLTRLNDRLIATLRYTGNNSVKKMAASRSELETWLQGQSRFRPIGATWWAQYDAPFVLNIAKRNEVQIEVVSTQ